MNAYELADKLEWHWDNDCRSPAVSKSADMLRQQADRISELEKQRKPVAWTDGRFNLSFDKTGICDIPLYTTPQTKPLSDEEIWKIYGITGLGNGMALRFARAIEERHGIK